MHVDQIHSVHEIVVGSPGEAEDDATRMAKKRKSRGAEAAPPAPAAVDEAEQEEYDGADAVAEPPTSKRKVLTHRCTSVGWMPSGVTSLSAHHPADGAGGYIAVGRENGNVEVWALDGQFDAESEICVRQTHTHKPHAYA